MATPRTMYARQRGRKKQRDGLLITSMVVVVLLFLGGSGYLLVNQSSIMRDVLRNRPSAVSDFVDTDTPGLYDVLDKEAVGEIDRVALSPRTQDPERAERLAEILPTNNAAAPEITTARQLEIARPATWYDPYLSIVREQNWSGIVPRIEQDFVDAKNTSVAWVKGNYDSVTNWAKDVTPTEALRQLGEASETAIRPIEEVASEPSAPPQVIAGPVDPASYGGEIGDISDRSIVISGVNLEDLIRENLAQTSDYRLAEWPDPYAGLLSSTQVPGLIELTPEGVLPRIGSNGQEPWRVYARAYNPLDNRPKIAFVITNLGLGARETAMAVQLPGEITLAFAPYAPRLDLWVQEARAKGHEFLLTLPMEPSDFPRSDPGPMGLLIELPVTENVRRLHRILSRTSGYVGLVNFLGGRFTLDPTAVRPIMEELNQRGLLYLDTQGRQISMASTAATVMGMPNLNVDFVLDANVTRQSLEVAKRDVLRTARTRGRVIVLIQPYEGLLNTLRDWLIELTNEDVILTPLTALAITEDGYL